MDSSTAKPRYAERRLALLLSLSLFAFFLVFQRGRFASTDEVGVFEQTRSLYERASLVVPPGYHVYQGREGRRYSIFGIGQSILAIPFYGLGVLAQAILPPGARRVLAGPALILETRRLAGGTLPIALVALYAPAATAVLSGLYFLWQRRLGASPRTATLVTLLVATTTYVATMSVYFLRHTTEAISILGGLYLFDRFGRDGRLRSLALGSLCSSACLVIRMASACVGPALAGYALWKVWRHRREAPERLPLGRALLALALPALAVATLHVVENQIKWGTYLSSPMLRHSFSTPLLHGLEGLLLSPGSSLFLYSPLLLLLPWMLPFFWRRARAECATALGAAAVLLVLSASFEKWHGMWSSPGPRLLFVLTPLLLLPFGPWWEAKARRRMRCLVAVLSLLGFAVQLDLLLASWPATVALNDYQAYAADKAFLFIPRLSPIVGSLRAVREGWVAPWLWALAVGWEGQEALPFVAAALFLGWVLGVGILVAATLRALGRLEASG